MAADGEVVVSSTMSPAPSSTNTGDGIALNYMHTEIKEIKSRVESVERCNTLSNKIINRIGQLCIVAMIALIATPIAFFLSGAGIMYFLGKSTSIADELIWYIRFWGISGIAAIIYIPYNINSIIKRLDRLEK